MTIESIPIQRTGLILRADPSRVLIRPFMPHTEERAAKICQRVLALSEEEVDALLARIETEYGERHLRTREFFQRRRLREMSAGSDPVTRVPRTSST